MMEQFDSNMESTMVTVVVEGEETECDRQALMDQSAYFQAMFSSNMMESRASKITINDVSSATFKQLIHFSTSDHCLKSVDTALELLQASAMLMFDQVQKECVQYLTQRVNRENCLEIMKTALNCGQTSLNQKARICALWEFPHLCRSPQLRALDFTEFQGYLSDRRLNAPKEIDVFHAITDWLEHNTKDTNGCYSELLDSIYCGSLTRSEKTLIEESWSKQHCDNFKEVSKQEQPTLQLLKNTEVRPGPWCLCLIGNKVQCNMWRLECDTTVVTAEHQSEPTPQHCDHTLPPDPTHLPTAATNLEKITDLPACGNDFAWGYKACARGRYWYVAGGEIKIGTRTRWIEDVWRYDAVEGLWGVLTNLPRPRRHHGIIAWEEHIYLVGGIGRHRVRESSVDRWNMNTGVWEALPEMNNPVVRAAVTVCRDKLYVLQNTVESWSPGHIVWTVITMPPCLQKHCVASAVTYEDDIYLTDMDRKVIYKCDMELKTCVEFRQWSVAEECSSTEEECSYIDYLEQGGLIDVGRSSFDSFLIVDFGQISMFILRVSLRDGSISPVAKIRGGFSDFPMALLPFYPKS